jgi:hypothetical protein
MMTVILIIAFGYGVVSAILRARVSPEGENSPPKVSQARKQAPTKAGRAARAVPPPRILGSDDLAEMDEWLKS